MNKAGLGVGVGFAVAAAAAIYFLSKKDKLTDDSTAGFNNGILDSSGVVSLDKTLIRQENKTERVNTRWETITNVLTRNGTSNNSLVDDAATGYSIGESNKGKTLVSANKPTIISVPIEKRQSTSLRDDYINMNYLPSKKVVEPVKTKTSVKDIFKTVVSTSPFLKLLKR